MKLIVLSALVAASAALASTPVSNPGKHEETYRQTIQMRAEKIVTPLGLRDQARAARVTAIITRQYSDLRDIQASREAKCASIKSEAKDEAVAEPQLKAARAAADSSVALLHATFLSHLAADLSPAQIDQVKDGMTYGVLPLTFRVYQEMLPTLTVEQKAQILAWLTEAREHAMDGFTSDEKHAWFGKYKGRINNFLAKAGFDLKQAEKEMLAREKKSSVAK